MLNKITAILILYCLINISYAVTIGSADIENLGNPYQSEYSSGEDIYARNVWDLQVYKDLIYIGAGNSSNDGPASNAGPVKIFYFNPANDSFVEEGEVDDEQIDIYRVFEDTLFIPGHDPLQSWRWGNYYIRSSANDWDKIRNIPYGIHNYDMAYHQGKLFAALGTEDGAAIAVSDDFGESWVNIQIGSSRAYSFATVGGRLYVLKKIEDQAYLEKYDYTNVYTHNGAFSFSPLSQVNETELYPDFVFDTQQSAKIVRVTEVNNQSIYIGAYKHNDHQFMPFGVFVAGNSGIRRVTLPQDYLAWDILKRDGYVALLLSSQLDNSNDYTIKVMISPESDLQNWNELLTFQSSTFARSFEYLNGDFYFGMGSEVLDPDDWSQSELKDATGDILRIKKQHY